MENIHILIIPSWYPANLNDTNGIFFREQAIALKKSGHTVGVIYAKKYSLRLVKKKEIKHNKILFENDHGVFTYRRFGWNWFPGEKLIRIVISIKIKDYITLFINYMKEHGKPDIIHAHSMLDAGIVAEYISGKFNIPFVVTEHQSKFAFKKVSKVKSKYLLAIYEHAYKIITVSPSLGNVLIESYNCPAEKIQYIPNMVDESFFTINVFQKESFIFLTISALVEIKGHKYLIEAFAQNFKGQNIQLWIGGDGGERANLENMVKISGIQQQVNFLGKLSREEVRQAMQMCDVFVLSSLYETFGVVLIEALSCGKPSIATKCGGPEIIVNEKNGRLIPVQDSHELGVAMLDMEKNIDNYNADMIREEAINKYGEAAVIKQLNSIYKAMVQ